MTDECTEDHLEFINEVCDECGLHVDKYGNTEAIFKYCSYPNCGCDGARLCMAGEASDAAASGNIEGMWIGNKPEHKKARRNLIIGTMEADIAAKKAKSRGAS